MRDAIARALAWTLFLLLPAHGRHRTTTPAVTTPAPVSPWARPWTGPSSTTARAVFTAPEARALTPEQREHFYATAWAELGHVYIHTVAVSDVHHVTTPAAVTA
ncbi:hypothetical protein [Streptomyces clavuligerus]|uniref:hypothetical protein n=1 Tax=Streptomyces clavuligerus TaxID=1901 RepID=UPI0018D0EF48|nr:hypothetical protein [Streptomyces clavuligerus]